MKKSYALFISLLITFFIGLLFTSNQNYRESVLITRVIDGDTLESENRIFRLANVNSPEKGEPHYLESINYLSSFVNKTLDVEIISLDNTGRREVARIYYKDKYLNFELVSRGLVPKSWVEKSELRKFNDAERKAINNELGIWKKSDFSDCVEVVVDAIKEEALLKIGCENLNLYGWKIKDESREFLIINKSMRIDFIVKSGENLSTNSHYPVIFWKKENIWNNDIDSIYLYDSANNIAFYKTYGYD